MSRLARLALAVVIAGLAGAPGAPVAAEDATVVTRALVRKLKAGSGEVAFERVAPDPMSGTSTTTRGTLTLEPPDRAALRFTATGERITLRGDGGEWLQPPLRQLVRFDRERATAALRWWQLMLDARSAAGFEALPRGPRTWTVVVRGGRGEPGDSARVRLAADGLPDRIAIDEGLGMIAEYRLRNWRFGPARGRAAFTVAPPKGYEVVELP